MIEVFTVGGGEYLVNTFNALAAWSGSGGYKALIRVVMVMGFAWALLIMAWNMDAKSGLKWFMQSTLMYMVMMVPTVTVKITDRTNPSVAGATVANVPVGIGLIAGFTSQIGDYLTRSAETVFTMPSALNYSHGGIIYGAKLLDATQGLRIDDPVLATNLNEHFKQCVFYDVLLGRKTMNDLTRTGDMLAAIGPGSVSLSQQFIFADGSSNIQTCESAYNLIVARWNDHYNAALPRIAAQFFPGIDTGTAQTKLTSDLASVGSAGLGGVGTSAQQLIRQAMFINAMADARGSFGNSAAQSAIDSFAQNRADIQTRNTYSTIAAGAMKWVPLLNIVLTVVFYAMFPVIFLLMLMPNSGPGVAKGYVTGFFYLSAWGPLFAVLNMIFMNRWSSSMTAWRDAGLTAANFSGVEAINQDAGALAGYMIMSVPFIAAGMARGAMAISSHSASFLSPSQRAAEEAAQEKTTGNYAYGNSSLMSRQFNTLQQDQLTTAPAMNSGPGRYTAQQADGGIVHHNADGTRTYDVGPGMSNLGFSLNKSDDFVARQQEALSQGRGVVDQKREGYSQSFSATMSKSSRLFDTAQQSVSSETSEGRAIQDSMSVMSQKSAEISEHLQRTGGFSKETADVMATQATRTGSIDLDAALRTTVGGAALQAMGVNLSAGGKIGTQWMASQSRNSSDRESTVQRMEESISSAERMANTETATQARDTFYRTTASSSNSELRGLSQDTQASLAETRSASRDVSRAEETYARYSSEIQQARSQGVQYGTNLGQEFANWWDTVGKNDPSNLDIRMSGWDPQMVNPTATQSRARDTAVNRFLDGKLDKIRDDFGIDPSKVQHRLEGPASTSLEGVKQFGEGSMAMVAGGAPPVSVARSARDEGLRDEVAERIGESQAAVGDRGVELRREHAAMGLEASEMRANLAERQTGSLWQNMSFAGDFRTPREDAARAAGPSVPSGPVDTVLPRTGIGYTTYGRQAGGMNQTGTREFIGDLGEIGQRWAARGGSPISFGDISKPGGGDMPGHTAHERGREVDLRPIRTDGRNLPVTWQSPKYDRDETRALVQTIRQQHPDATILFNDPVLVREGLVQRYDGHDNHLHLRLPNGSARR